MTLRRWQPGAGLADTTALVAGGPGTGNVLDLTGTYGANLSGGSGTRTASSDHVHGGLNTAKLLGTSGQNSVLWFSLPSNNLSAAAEVLFYYTGTPPAINENIVSWQNASATYACHISVNATTGKLVLSNPSFTQLWISAAALPGAGWYRIALTATVATASTGTAQIAYYSDMSATAIETSSALTGLNLGTALLSKLEVGRRSVNASTFAAYITDVQIDDGATSFIGAYSAYDAVLDMWATVADSPVTYDALLELWATSAGSNYDSVLEMWATSSAALTVDAGPDASFEPNLSAKLSPVFSNPPGSVVYAQTAGPAVLLVGTGLNRAYLTPAVRDGATLTFQVTATPAGGGSPVVDTVTHTIYPQLVWAMNTAGQQRPVHLGPTPTVTPDP